MINRALGIGDVCISNEPLVLATILGSCVAVCLFEDRQKIGGMNHFLLPHMIRGINNPLCCGYESTERLIQGILNMGADIRRLQAKVFGGGKVQKNIFLGSQIGEQNVTTAKKKLDEYGIPVVGEFTGAESGLKVYFHTDSGRAFLKEIKTPRLKYSAVEFADGMCPGR